MSKKLKMIPSMAERKKMCFNIDYINHYDLTEAYNRYLEIEKECGQGRVQLESETPCWVFTIRRVADIIIFILRLAIPKGATEAK